MSLVKWAQEVVQQCRVEPPGVGRCPCAMAARGVFHLAGRDRVSKFEFGRLLAAAAGLSMAHAARGSIDAAGLVADRPKEMSIASSRLSEVRMDPPGCADGLRRFVGDRSRRLSERF